MIVKDRINKKLWEFRDIGKKEGLPFFVFTPGLV